MLDCAQRVCADAGKDSADAQKPMLAEYRPDEIVSYIEQHPEYRRIAVLLSGDTGFYSGAKRLAEQLTERFRKIQDKGAEQCRIELIPGISSVVYLAAKLNTSWEDAALVSLHGKDADFIQTVHRNRKTFLLLGGQGVMSVRKRLLDYRMDHVTVHAGSRLSYEDERIISGKPSQISEEDLKGLCTVLIENPCPERSACAHVSDEDFIRGNVPMTKEEVRAVSIARLRLTEDAVVWDVGAGTGSVSVEAARSGRPDPGLCGGEEPGCGGADPGKQEEIPDGRHPCHLRQGSGGAGTSGSADPCVHRREFGKSAGDSYLRTGKEQGCAYRHQCHFSGDSEGSDGSG